MNKPMEQERLEDVLDAYVASGGDPNSPLDEWIRRYPEFEQELIDFAASWSLMNGLPPEPGAKQVDEKTLVLRGMSVVQNLLHRHSAESAPRFRRAVRKSDSGGAGKGVSSRAGWLMLLDWGTACSESSTAA